MKDFVIPWDETGKTGLQDDCDMGTPEKSGAPVTLKIDGFDVTVPEGTSVMRAAAEAGISVPKLCASDNLEAFGSCRLCSVEIEGRRGLPASCTTPVAEGMIVKTQTPKVQKLRKGVMELYISDHPLDCLTCGAKIWLVSLVCVMCAMTLRPRILPPARPQDQTRNTCRKTKATRISPMSHPNVSRVRAACAPAKRCKALLL